MKFNINDYVGVQLNTVGIRIYLDAFEKYGAPRPKSLPPMDDEGYTSLQLWEVMSIFGSELHNGMVIQPFETTIKFDSKDFS